MTQPLMERTPPSLITDGVKEDEQTLHKGKPFWVLFVGNMGLGTWLMGVLLAGMGLNFATAMIVLLLSGVIGSLLPAALAIMGPHTRLSQMEVGRLSLGINGKKLPAFLNWVGAIGWDAIVNILSASALSAMLLGMGWPTPFWVSLTVLVSLQLVIGIYGHHLIQNMSRYTGILLGVFFVIIGLVAMHKLDLVFVSDKTDSLKDILSAFVLLVAYNGVGWATYTSDYTRYLPRQTPTRTVFLSIFSGLLLSFLVLTFFGYMTASAVTEQTPQGVMEALRGVTGSFATLVFFLIAFNSIPANAVNDNSAAYSLISAGIKVSRPVSAVIGSVLGYIICLLASGSFIDSFENFLFLFAHWIAPWSAIILVHWFVAGKRQMVGPASITRGAVIFMAVSVGSILLFSANSLYTGALSDAVADVDVGPYIGFVIAATAYYASLRLWPLRDIKPLM